MTRRFALALVLLVASPQLALAAGGEPSAISIALPPRAAVGQLAEAQARLTDAKGAPIAKALVRFTATLAFLESASEVVLADARTDATGLAVARFDLRTEGTLTVNATFAGDERYAPARASGDLVVEGGGQVYEQHAGVRLPGLNAEPAAIGGNGSPAAGLFDASARLWPAMSGWPVVLVLMIVWSLYGGVVVLLFRIARSAGTEHAR